MHSLGTDTAIACFKEATTQINKMTDPGQWNLANGLANLAYALKQMEDAIDTLKAAVHELSEK